MSRYFILLICVMAVAVQGRPRHHKHKQAHAETQKTEDTQAYHQPAGSQLFSDAPAGPQDLNVYNVHVHKMTDNNKVSGHIAPHSVAVSMQGPGSVSLSTSQTVVGPAEDKPDHTISMVKDTGGCKGPECSMVNVKSGHQLPMPLPLSEPPTPVEAPKQAKPHDQKPATPPIEPVKLHTKPQLKAVEPQEELSSLVEHAKEHAAAVHSDHRKVEHAHNHENKDHGSEIITNLEGSIPVTNHKPEHDVQVNNGHKVFITHEDKPQKVFGQMDSNNVGVSVQGGGTVSVTSQFDVPQLSQHVVFDPMPAEPCRGPQCSQGTGSEHKGKGHH